MFIIQTHHSDTPGKSSLVINSEVKMLDDLHPKRKPLSTQSLSTLLPFDFQKFSKHRYNFKTLNKCHCTFLGGTLVKNQLIYMYQKPSELHENAYIAETYCVGCTHSALTLFLWLVSVTLDLPAARSQSRTVQS